MIGAKLIMTCYFVFMVGNVLCMIIEGSYFSADDVDLMNALSGYSVLEVSGAGVLAVPKMAVGFFTHGLPTMLLWQYSFLEGGWEIFKWICLFPLTIGVIYPIGLLAMNIAQGIFGAIR